MQSSNKIPLGQIENIDKDTVGLGNVDNTQQIPLADKGANNGVAELDSNGKVPVSQLPSYVSDVETYPTLSLFPATGVDNIIYIAEDTNLTYRWTGSAYVEISPSIALGETSSTAYRGDRGKIAYDHSQLTSGNPHNVTKTDVGLSNVDNTSDANKPISTATQNALDSKLEVGVGIPLSTVLYAGNVAPIPIVLDYASLVFDNSSNFGSIIHLSGTNAFDASTYYQELQNKSGTIALLSDIVTPGLDAVVSVDGSVYSSPIMIMGDMFKISGDGGFTFTTLNSDNTSDRTQTLQDKDGTIALLSDIQGPGNMLEYFTDYDENDDLQPIDYATLGGHMVNEIKNYHYINGLDAIFSGGNYCNITTYLPGGYALPYQIATNFIDGKMVIRTGSNEYSWNEWEEIGGVSNTYYFTVDLMNYHESTFYLNVDNAKLSSITAVKNPIDVNTYINGSIVATNDNITNSSTFSIGSTIKLVASSPCVVKLKFIR